MERRVVDSIKWSSSVEASQKDILKGIGRHLYIWISLERVGRQGRREACQVYPDWWRIHSKEQFFKKRMGAAMCQQKEISSLTGCCHFLSNSYCNSLTNCHSVSNLPFLGNTMEKTEVGQPKETPGEQQHLSSIMLLTWTGSGNSTENPTGDLLWAMDKGHMLVLLVKLPVLCPRQT